jgi:hypothetical protein
MKEGIAETGSLLGSVGAVITSTAASICCIGPLGIALLGVNGAILGATLKPYRPYLLTSSLLMLGFAHWAVARKNRNTKGEACSVRSGRVVRFVLWAATAMWFAAALIQFAADRYWL